MLFCCQCNLDIEITGFEAAEIDSLMGDLVDPEMDPADTVPEIEQIPISRRADLWLLGRHRLICGDACSDADIRALMGRERADMVFADSPYNVSIAATVGRGKTKYREFASIGGLFCHPLRPIPIWPDCLAGDAVLIAPVSG